MTWRPSPPISLFALGHSATLLIATLAGRRVNPVAVDVVVALSLVFAGVVGLLGMGERRWFAPAVAGFGLVHGLGLATRLQDLNLPEEGKVARVLAFNVGVEIGQMIAIAVVIALAAGIRRLPQGLRPTGRTVRVAQAALVACGVVAAGLLRAQNRSRRSASAVRSVRSGRSVRRSPPGPTGRRRR